jgi:hypothetical protein
MVKRSINVPQSSAQPSIRGTLDSLNIKYALKHDVDDNPSIIRQRNDVQHDELPDDLDGIKSYSHQS